jgi:hypothetical protein
MPFFKVKQTQRAIRSSFNKKNTLVNIINRIKLVVLKGTKRSLYKALKSISNR